MGLTAGYSPDRKRSKRENSQIWESGQIVRESKNPKVSIRTNPAWRSGNIVKLMVVRLGVAAEVMSSSLDDVDF
jgi:hypothetical protein